MMRKKISWLFLLMVFLTLFSCRNDYFPEPGTRQYNNASQFQVVKFSDIPQVARFIKLKTGRNDLKIPIKSAHGFSAEAKANIDFANLETNFIIKKTENNRVFYISNISNAGDENTLYNFEAREAEGSIVDARIIEYSSEVPFGEKPLEVLSDFTGRVRMYDLQGKETAGITFINGGETCDDNPADPPSDSGGGGGSGGDDTPPPPPPGPPNWPQNPGPVYGGGDNGGSSGGNNGSSGSGNNSGSNSGTNCGSWQLSHYLYDGPCNGPACSNIIGAVFVNDCNESMPVYLSQNKNSNYAAKTTNFSAPCGGNSGVVVVEPTPRAPCLQLKTLGEKQYFKDKMDVLKANVNTGTKEKGFVLHENTSTPISPIVIGSADNNTNALDYSPYYNSISNDLNVLNSMYGNAHNHLASDTTHIGIFPPHDLNALALYGGMEAHPQSPIYSNPPKKAVTFLITDKGLFALKINDLAKLTAFVVDYSGWSDKELKKYIEEVFQNEDEYNIRHQSTHDELVIGFLRFIKDKDIGVDLYEGNKNTYNNWRKLELINHGNGNYDFTEIPCNL